ncbi:hypothetical protein LX36DRAFT_486286 [Colletotrichum falcatum]|nr:hypothetical protein LX36DRAFT_486286 [Colletotrichum falcatum]
MASSVRGPVGINASMQGGRLFQQGNKRLSGWNPHQNQLFKKKKKRRRRRRRRRTRRGEGHEGKEEEEEERSHWDGTGGRAAGFGVYGWAPNGPHSLSRAACGVRSSEAQIIDSAPNRLESPSTNLRSTMRGFLRCQVRESYAGGHARSCRCDAVRERRAVLSEGQSGVGVG